MRGRHNYYSCRFCGEYHIPPFLGKSHSLEERQKMAKAIRESPTFRAGMIRNALARKGRELSIEHRLHISQAKKGRPGSPKYHPILEPSPTLAYILGVLKGDGCVYHSVIQLSVADREFAESFAHALSKLGLPARVIPIRMRGKEHFRAFVSSIVFAQWYKGLPFAEFETMAQNHPIDFLRGFYESEGWFDCRRQAHMANTKEHLLYLCAELLIQLGFNPTLRKYELRKPKGYIYWRLGLHRQKEAETFVRTIKPCIKKGDIA